MKQIETEDKISLMVVLISVFFVFAILFSAWRSPNNALTHIIKSSLNQIKCESMDGDGNKCAAYQRQTGKCAWYGACNKCSEAGQVESQLCAITKKNAETSEKNQTEPTPRVEEKSKITPSSTHCAKFNDKVDDCIEAQRNGSKCAWYSGCQLCILEGTYSNDDFARMCASKAKPE